MLLVKKASISQILNHTPSHTHAHTTIVMCLDLIDPANGTISFSQGVMVGSVATYTCNDPYILSENSNPICEASAVGAMWSGSQPTCNFPDFNSGKYMNNYYRAP